MAIDGTPSPILSVGTADVDDLSEARRFSHENAYELSKGTLAFDVTPDTTSGRQGLFSKDAEFFGDGGHFTVWIEDGRITARLQSEDRSYEIHGGSVQAGETTAVAVTFGPSGFKLFVDGEKVDQNDYKGGLQHNNEPIVVGASAWGSDNEAAAQLTHEFKGTISNLGLYDEVLSAKSIRGETKPSEHPTESSQEAASNLPAPVFSISDAEVEGLSEASRFSHEKGYELPNGTLAFNVIPDSTSGRQGLFSKDAEFFGDGGHLTVWLEDGKITARLQSDEASYELTGGSVDAGDGASVAVVFGSGGFKLFVDGEQVDQNDYRGGLQNNKEPIVVGASSWASRDESAAQLTHEFKGEITDLGLYGEALSDEVIRDLAKGSSEAPAEDPVTETPDTPTDKPEEPTEDSGSDEDSGEAPSDLPAPILSVGTANVDNLSEATRMSHKDAYALSDGTLAFTVTADGVSGRQGLFSKDAEFFGDGGHFTIWLEDGEITARLQSEDQSYELHGGSVAAGEAAAVAVSFGKGGFKLFVDGEEVDRSGYEGGIETNGEPIVIGASAWASRDGAADALTHEFKGEITDLGLYGEALSQDAIRSLAGVTDGAPQEPVDQPDEPVTEAPEEPVDQPEEPVDPDPVEQPEEPAVDPDPAPEPEPANSAPALDNSATERSVTEGETNGFALDGIFSDPDGDELQFTLADAPDFVSISDDGRLTLAPGQGDSGSYGFSITASDGTATSAAFEVTVNVTAPAAPEETPPEETPEETPGGGNTGSGYTPQTVSLTAGLGIVNTNQSAPQSWGEGVTLTGYDLNGNMAKVGITNQWDDVGFGVQGNGSRWQDQIDYYASGGGRSEKLVVDFNGEVTDVVARIGMLGETEGPNNTPETGTWKAYDGNGNLVDQGQIGPKYSTLGNSKKEDGSYGLFPIAIGADAPFERVEFEATQFDYGNGSSTTRDYGENSSDYNLVGLDFLRLEPTDDILV